MSEIENIKPGELATIETPNPMQLIASATASGADVAVMEGLFALQERYEANEARKAFIVALDGFKNANIVIDKNNQVSFGKENNITSYKHATLDHICKLVEPELRKQGLSFSWGTGNTDSGAVRVTCKIMHRYGHSEETSLAGPSDQSGGKNAIQAIGSTITYLQRYTLLASLGLPTTEDTDGVTPSVVDDAKISPSDAANIEVLASEVIADAGLFFAFMTKTYGYEIKSYADILARDLDRAKFAIKIKKDAANETA